jgi:hypothetical protein
VALLTLSACTLQKRVYNRGVNIEWFESKGSDKVAIISPKKSDEKRSKYKNKIVEESKTNVNSFENYRAIPSQSMFSYSDSVSTPYTKNILNNINGKKLIVKTELDNKKTPLIKEIKSNIKNRYSTKASSSDNKDGNATLSFLGWLIWAIGLFNFFFVSMVLGVLGMILGLIFIILGKKKKNPSTQSDNNNNNKPEYLDVVYLKNGGIIKGMIIEQTPNVQIKIQTKDGSVFVYKFEEIEKIAKEQTK